MVPIKACNASKGFDLPIDGRLGHEPSEEHFDDGVPELRQHPFGLSFGLLQEPDGVLVGVQLDEFRCHIRIYQSQVALVPLQQHGT